jgi:hypothetical protein
MLATFMDEHCAERVVIGVHVIPLPGPAIQYT